MIDALRTSIETGVALMDKYFDKVTLELSDSEDDGEEEEEEKRYDLNKTFSIDLIECRRFAYLTLLA